MKQEEDKLRRDYNQKLNEKETEITEKDAKLTEQNVELTEQDTKLAANANEMKEKDAQLNVNAIEMKKMDEEIATKNDELQNLQIINDRLTGENRQLENEKIALEQTASSAQSDG
eukprot:TRINITY_DN7790_c0_g1_i1.p1 TRINITY_DN7790_c0_g1~~TRINITY_DN7790_c0_g1_i1.p1  ORF type:complete len:133 (+),score=41.56 TRINITY_DN7790_c0_g1_i1:57-401(+)